MVPLSPYTGTASTTALYQSHRERELRHDESRSFDHVITWAPCFIQLRVQFRVCKALGVVLSSFPCNALLFCVGMLE